MKAEGSVRATWAEARRDWFGRREGEGQPRIKFMCFFGGKGDEDEADILWMCFRTIWSWRKESGLMRGGDMTVDMCDTSFRDGVGIH